MERKFTVQPNSLQPGRDTSFGRTELEEFTVAVLTLLSQESVWKDRN